MVVFLGLLNPLYAQNKDVVKILNSDLLKLREVDGRSLRMLVGNVRLQQKNVLMYCDSAILNRDSNKVDAYGSVHINQNDSVHIYSEILKYNGNTQLAALYNNVRLTDDQIEIETGELFYNLGTKIAYYFKGAVITDPPTVLSSNTGYYYSETEDLFFKDSVVITDPNYVLVSDSMEYNTISKIAKFRGKTEIENEDSRIICHSGWYDTQEDVASFGENTTLENPPQKITADSFYYERHRGFGKAIRSFVWTDEEMDMIMFGTYGEYYEPENFMTAINRPLLIYIMEDDSLYLSADTLKSKHIEESDQRFFYAYYDVKMYSRDMQAVCDSLYFSFNDSAFQMYYEPTMWNGETQMTADTIILTVAGKKIDKVLLNKSAFIISPAEDLLNDQVKGKDMTAYFKDNDIHKMHVVGNAESIYFGEDEENRYVGMNKSLSSEIWLYFKDRKTDRIKFIKRPEAVFTPLREVRKEDIYLKGFQWKGELKPLTPMSVKEKTVY